VLPSLTGITVNGVGIDVTLRGLTINGDDNTTHGIVVQQASRVRIEDCTITNTGLAIQQLDSTDLVVTKSTLTGSGWGLNARSGTTMVAASQLLQNGVGIYVSAGPSLVATGNLAVARSVVANNSTQGIDAAQSAGTSYRVVVDGTVSRANGGAGIRAVSSSIGINNTVSGYVFDSVLDGNQDGARVEALPEGAAMLRLWTGSATTSATERMRRPARLHRRRRCSRRTIGSSITRPDCRRRTRGRSTAPATTRSPALTRCKAMSSYSRRRTTNAYRPSM
jgi:hypothetical protein